MYESEVYLKYIVEQIPEEIHKEFVKTYSSIENLSFLHWTEHCTECAMPQCFKTCDLYAPRLDGKCQRFLNGIELIKSESRNEMPDLLKINFKKWAFHFMIWVLIINLISFYLTISYTNLFYEENNTLEVLFYFGVLATILIVLSLIFIVISSIKKEKKNYQYWSVIIGLVVFGILPIVASLF